MIPNIAYTLRVVKGDTIKGNSTYIKIYKNMKMTNALNASAMRDN